MGNFSCCAEREDQGAKAYLVGLQRDQSELNDLVLFDRAYKLGSVPMLIDLLGSAHPFTPKENSQHTHPWARAPTTVSALAATQLAALASTEDEHIQKNIMDHDGVPKLLFLVQASPDQRDAALIALSFLSSEMHASQDEVISREMPERFFLAECFTILIKLIRERTENIRARRGSQGAGAGGSAEAVGGGVEGESPPSTTTPSQEDTKVQVQAAAAQICRNVFACNEKYRRAFADAGGLQALVDVFQTVDDLDTRIECLYHIEDFVTETSTMPPLDPAIPKMIRELPGFVQTIDEVARTATEGDLIEAANSLLEKLG